MSKLRLLQASAAAEKAWMAEVAAVFGARDASYARFQDRASGDPGSSLRTLHDAYAKAWAAYQAAR
jgi:hypothetical protein